MKPLLLLLTITALGSVVLGSMAGTLWNFDSDLVGGLPVGWNSRGGPAASVYRVETEPGGNRYLAARSEASDIQLGTSVDVDLRQTPMITWRWRVGQFPRNSDESKLETMDSAAAVYVVFGSRLFPRILKYVWSEKLAVGSTFRHPRYPHMATIVVASGPGARGEWSTVQRDVVEDSKRFLDASPTQLNAIGVKTDSDSTSSSARADYDDLMFVPRAQSRVSGL